MGLFPHHMQTYYNVQSMTVENGKTLIYVYYLQ